jgi:hypothetical protein
MVEPSPRPVSTGSPALFPPDPEKECDIVMKGGITSGVVYPPAVLELQQTYRFRSIGGTSAGAIAAAVTAAAEFDRAGGGFERLAAVRDQLCQPGFLLGLFTAQKATRPLMNTLVKLFMPGNGEPLPLGGSWPAGNGERVKAARVRLQRLAAILQQELPAESRRGGRLGIVGGLLAVACILLPAVAVAAVGWRDPLGWLVVAAAALVPLLLAVLLGGFLGRLIAPLIGLGKIVLSLPRDCSFGLCSGLAEAEPPAALTNWLADTIDRLAGLPKVADPLTFADLERKHRKAGENAGGAPPAAAITLRMVTSDLSLGSPLVLPRVGDFARNDLLFFEPEMRRLFPGRIVDYLVRARYRSTDHPESALPRDFYYLPPGNALPVIVAARLSLSFPFLLSAVPLYSIKLSGFTARDQAGAGFRYKPDEHFAKHWLSDGGICSNFPIHFFDAWAPERPTFGINLADVQVGAKQAGGEIKEDAIPMSEKVHAVPGSAYSDPLGEVFLPHPNQTSAVQLPWRPIGSLFEFVMAIFDTGQGYHDALQAMLPSYRERIVQIRLEPSEGGLNLTMQPDTIRRMQDKGTRAADALRGMDFPQHRWTRFLVLMAQLEQRLDELGKIYPGMPAVKAMLDEQAAKRWYKHKPAIWSVEAEARMTALLALIDAWKTIHPADLFAADPPKPPAVLRVTPPV